MPAANKMNKNINTIVGWVLIVILMIGFVFYQTKKYEEEQKKKKAEQALTQKADSLAHKNDVPAINGNTPASSAPATQGADSAAATAAVNTDSLARVNVYGAFAGASVADEKTFVIENELQKITLTNKGGQIKSIELKNYKTWDKKPLILFTNQTNQLSFQIPVGDNKIINTEDLYFEPVGETFNVKGTDKKTFALRLMAGEGKYFEQKYTLTGNSYLFNFDINIVGLGDIIPANNNVISGQWKNTLSALERTLELERRYSALYYRYNESDVAHLSEDNETDEITFDAPVEWISYKQQFFNTTIFSKGLFHKGRLQSNFGKKDTGYVKKYTSVFTLPYQGGNSVSYNFQLYIGPNHYNTLASLDKDLEDIVKLGPNPWFFRWIKYITRFIIWVFSWFQNMNLNYGIIILLMTLMLKIILHPLTSKSIESAAKMKILAPEIEALKEKYGDDQTKIGQEQMKLYQRAGVSPFGGCLPLLLQMPILMAMYYFFPASIELRQQSFLWAHDLSSYDDVIKFGTTILGQSHLSIFTVLMTITSILQAVMNNQMNSMANQQPGMKYLPYIMPVMLMFVFNNFPAALTYYYLLQNLLGVAHQFIIQRFFIDDAKLRAQIEENKKNPKQASGWQKKLEEMQREAANRQKPKK